MRFAPGGEIFEDDAVAGWSTGAANVAVGNELPELAGHFTKMPLRKIACGRAVTLRRIHQRNQLSDLLCVPEVVDMFAIEASARCAALVTATAVQDLRSGRILSGAAFLGVLAGARLNVQVREWSISGLNLCVSSAGPRIERHDVSRGVIKNLISMGFGIGRVLESGMGQLR